ncbi:DUF5996 family protein [Paractinoplanes durhamensis]|uniref:Ava_C0101 and related proteins n=1 Tax=Paractinoplanes durhamensis TaxID=113563 RepID=A0ABQ3YUD5_9ACTN|nr:DUF5996 family protein [Actinoplanes durhamensis]GIE01211.1 hypothetical protein Adu01nite_25610 [Actinoplanes durhamensis]
MSADKIEWPRLRVADWTATRDTLHMWTQIVGKIRMALTPPINHWWHVTLYPTARGLSTSAMPYEGGTLDIEFDFLDHVLRLRTGDGRAAAVALEPKPVATFYAETMDALATLGVRVQIHAVPNEVENAIPFAEDTTHASYDADAVRLFWQQLLRVERALAEFRNAFVGKASPVHFFWGAMDLAHTRFSGRLAPPHPGVAPNCPPSVMHEGYSHELASFGFWPGGGDEGAFYAYAYPEPPGYAQAPVWPAATYYDEDLREFLLPYEAVATAPDPDRALHDFLESTYLAAADVGHWDRQALERSPSEG